MMKKSIWVKNHKRNLWMVFLFIAAFRFSAFASDCNITVNAGTNEGWVPYTMFGANFVIGKNDFDTNWISVFESCGMGMIRYPGGGVTETAFDYLTNAPYMTNILLYCKDHAAVRPVFVVPTYRFANDVAAGAAYASNFVKYVNVTLHKNYGTPRVTRWELGNEYYQELAPEIYAEIADAQAAAMIQADPNIIPIVFYKRDLLSETQVIGDYISSGSGCISACSTHIYPGDSENVGSVIPSQLLVGCEALGFPLTDYVTEWNASKSSATYPSGLALANRQLAIFKSLVLSGVKYASIWPLVWNPNTVDCALAKYNGVFRPQGQAYQWLQQSAKATFMVECINDSTILDATAFKYLQTDRLSVLVSGYSLPTNSSVCLTVNGFTFNPTTGVSAQRLYAPNGDVYANTPATITALSPSVFGAATNKLSFTINKNSQYEIIKIDLTP